MRMSNRTKPFSIEEHWREVKRMVEYHTIIYVLLTIVTAHVRLYMRAIFSTLFRLFPFIFFSVLNRHRITLAVFDTFRESRFRHTVEYH